MGESALAAGTVTPGVALDSDFFGGTGAADWQPANESTVINTNNQPVAVTDFAEFATKTSINFT